MPSSTSGSTGHPTSPPSSSAKPGLLAKCASSIDSFLDSTAGSHLTRLATTGLLATAYSKWNGGDEISNSFFSPLPLLSMVATAAAPAALKCGTSCLSGAKTSAPCSAEVSNVVAQRGREAVERLCDLERKKMREVSRASRTNAMGRAKTPAEMAEEEASLRDQEATEKRLQEESLARIRAYAPSCATSIVSSFAGQWLAPFAVGLAEMYTGTELSGPMEWMATREAASLLSKGISEVGQQVVKMCGYPRFGEAIEEPTSDIAFAVSAGTGVEEQSQDDLFGGSLARTKGRELGPKLHTGVQWDEESLRQLFSRLGAPYSTGTDGGIASAFPPPAYAPINTSMCQPSLLTGYQAMATAF